MKKKKKNNGKAVKKKKCHDAREAVTVWGRLRCESRMTTDARALDIPKLIQSKVAKGYK